MYINADIDYYTPTTFELVNPYALLDKIGVQEGHSNASKHGFNKKEVEKRRKRNKNKKTHRKRRK